MIKPKDYPWKARALPATVDRDEDPLPAHIAQDVRFCQAMVNAGYKLIEMDKVT